MPKTNVRTAIQAHLDAITDHMTVHGNGKDEDPLVRNVQYHVEQLRECMEEMQPKEQFENQQ